MEIKVFDASGFEKACKVFGFKKNQPLAIYYDVNGGIYTLNPVESGGVIVYANAIIVPESRIRFEPEKDPCVMGTKEIMKRLGWNCLQ